MCCGRQGVDRFSLGIGASVGPQPIGWPRNGAWRRCGEPRQARRAGADPRGGAVAIALLGIGAARLAVAGAVIDRHLLPALGRIYAAPAQRLAAAGVSANAVTVAGFALGLLAAVLIALGAPLPGLAALLGNRVMDGLDGAVARLAGPTERGAFLDIALDFFVYAAIPFGFALADPGRNALAAAALLFAFIGTASSFLAFAVIAARAGLQSSAYPRKGIYYLGGLAEGAETIICLSAMCLAPAWFSALAWGFAALCLATTLTRWWSGIRQFDGGAA